MTHIYFEFEGEKCWIEVDDNAYATRQIVRKANDEILVSCRDECLAEGIVDTETDCERITQTEFDTFWRQATEKYWNDYEKHKLVYPVGKSVSGSIQYFYPQGVIFLSETIYFCGEMTSCKRNAHPSALYPGHLVNGLVSGYDDENMWILINHCHVE